MRKTNITKETLHLEEKIYKLEKKVHDLEKAYYELSSTQRNNNNLDEYLTINEICKRYKINRKTFDRYRINGLAVIQKVPNGKILVNKITFENFIKE